MQDEEPLTIRVVNRSGMPDQGLTTRDQALLSSIDRKMDRLIEAVERLTAALERHQS